MDIDWKFIHKHRNAVFLISDGGKATHELDVNKEVFANTDTYVSYNIKPDIYNKDMVKDFITKYHITERIVDQYNNLLLIADYEVIDI
ncbi:MULTISPECIES: hypothetical protein [Cytobacillus]|uniref:hypothetical protein n=1 Tax=Cytobacillus TaxID=2675230 RepID=UPI00203CA354|nr:MULTISPECIES: hypothetical protein [Cytobacillus]MCM3394851.1 hypothetical protein [Cytobacillus oceanisediminis]UQX56070.1 hypothetical protein M5V91_10815 [Cytobacillus pseudoceanisediminis]